LDEHNFVWDAPQVAWEQGLDALLSFKQREGHCRVPQGHLEGNFYLGTWVSTQRSLKEKLSPERKRRLDEHNFVWDAPRAAWEEGFDALLSFKRREGHCRVPQGHLEGNFKLGSWVNTQRRAKPKLSADRIGLLDEQNFVWELRQTMWEEGFTALMRFKQREGHCRVSIGHLERNFELGIWVANQRRAKPKLSADRISLLDEHNFVWDPFQEAWEEGFAVLMRFKQREGHCRVPNRHFEGNFKLGTWVSNQRASKRGGSLSNTRIARLDAESFEWKLAAATQRASD
jgi:hypothetical protein